MMTSNTCSQTVASLAGSLQQPPECGLGVCWTQPNLSRRRDIFHIAFILRCMLPSDLVPYIMQAADFLEITSASVFMRPTDNRSMEGTVILATPPIRTKVRRHRPAQRVVLNVVMIGSRGNDHDKEGLWTRFTAGKARSPISQTDLDPILAVQHPGISATQHHDETLPAQALLNPDQDNISPYKVHTVVWDRDSVATPRYERNMIENMQRGDQMKLVMWQSPHACKPGPRYISASISIYTTVIVA